MATRHALVRRRIYANLSSWGFSLMNCSFHSFIWIGSIGLKIYIYIYHLVYHLTSKQNTKSFFSSIYPIGIFQFNWTAAAQFDSLKHSVGFPPFARHRVRRLWGSQQNPQIERIAGGNFINFDFLGYSLLFKKIETICGLDIDDVVYNDKHVKVIVTKKLYMSHVHLIWGYYPTPTAPRTKGCRFHLGLRHKVSHGTFCHNLRAHWHGL